MMLLFKHMLESRLSPASIPFSIMLVMCLLQPCCAHVSAEQMQTEIAKSNVLPADSKVTAAINGAELILSIYKHESATENDCKIDAVLIAKTAFALDPELSRASILFYDPRVPNAYYEVPVTVGDVTAFASGQLSREKLLSALKLTRMAAAQSQPTASTTKVPDNLKDREAPPGVETDRHAQDSHGPVTIGSGETKTSAGADRASAPQGRTVYSAYGVTLNYPSSWKIEYPRGGNTAVRFRLPARTATTIDMQVYSAKDISAANLAATDPRDTLYDISSVSWIENMSDATKPYMQEMMQHHSAERKAMESYSVSHGKYGQYRQWATDEHNHHSTLNQVAVPAAAAFGKNKSVHCAQSAYWIVHSHHGHHGYHGSYGGGSAPHFTRMVAFNCGAQVVLLGLFCGQADAGDANLQFEQLLANLECASAPPAKSPKAATSKKGNR